MNENIVTGKKYRILKDAQADAWDTVSFWKKSCDGELENGKTVEEGLSELGELLDHVTGVGVILNVNTTTESFNGLTVTASNAAEAVTGQFVDGAAKLVLHFIGGYTVSVTDAKGHTFSKSITVAQIGEVLSTTINEVFSTVNITTTSSDIVNANIRVSVGGNTVDTIKFTNSSATYKAYDIATYTFTVTSGGSDYSESVSITAMNQTKSVTIDTLKIVTWASGTWDEIGKMIDAHYAGKIDVADYWSVGDVKSVILNSSTDNSGLGKDISSQTIQLQIIGIKHDVFYSDTSKKTAITVQQKGTSISGMINFVSGQYTDANWKTCKGRNWCNNTYMSALPSSLSTLIKSVYKNTVIGCNVNNYSQLTYGSESIFFLSNWEIFGQKYNTTYVFLEDGAQYDYYKTASNRKKYNGNSVACMWWTRSSYYKSYPYYVIVGTDGAQANAYPNDTIYYAPAFCL